MMAHFSAAGGAGGGPIIKREWRNDASGDWHSGGNWTPTGVPNEVTQTAVFGSVITAPRVVYMETDVTAVKSIEFLKIKQKLDPHELFASDMYRRLLKAVKD